MKILIVHNDYGTYSGEEAVVDKMTAMFTAHGHEVVQLRMTSEGARDTFVGKMRGFFAGVYSPSGVKAMREALRREKPDVVNVHNLYPFISPAALRECRKMGVPVVMTVHNFRLICPTGLFMRNDTPCELCLERGDEWNCVRYNCEHSLFKSVGYALRNAVARITRAYKDNVDVFACITDFQRRKLEAAGFDSGRLTVIPNAADFSIDIEQTEGEYVAFCGRLSREKGIDLIVSAARRHPDIEFRLAGAVRDKELVEDLPSNVHLEGYLSGESLERFYRDAKFFVMASRCYEGFPMAIIEAANYYKPTIAPDHGGFTEIVGSGEEASGLLFTPSDADSLSQCIERLWNSPDEVLRFGRNARAKLERQYSSEAVYRQWENLLKEINKPYNIK
ncbi:MAG: glycosyltransferase family 4 protein [Alistipes sp.]|nr:glycosyltransferase family 4 protein [Alistipes sp.]